MHSAAPVRGGGTGHRPDGAAATSRSPIATGAPYSGVKPLPSTAPRGGGGAPAGAAGPVRGPPVPLLWPRQNPVPAVPGRHGGQPDPDSRQGRNCVVIRHRPHTNCRHRQPRRHYRLDAAQAISDPHSPRVDLTAQIPPPHKGFPSEFLGPHAGCSWAPEKTEAGWESCIPARYLRPLLEQRWSTGWPGGWCK